MTYEDTHIIQHI